LFTFLVLSAVQDQLLSYELKLLDRAEDWTSGVKDHLGFQHTVSES